MLGCPVTAPSLTPLIDAITTLVQGLAILSKPATAVIPLLQGWLTEVASLDPTSAGPPTFVDQLTSHENPPEPPDVSGVRWAFFISSASGAHALRVKLPATRTLLCIPAGRFPVADSAPLSFYPFPVVLSSVRDLPFLHPDSPDKLDTILRGSILGGTYDLILLWRSCYALDSPLPSPDVQLEDVGLLPLPPVRPPRGSWSPAHTWMGLLSYPLHAGLSSLFPETHRSLISSFFVPTFLATVLAGVTACWRVYRSLGKEVRKLHRSRHKALSSGATPHPWRPVFAPLPPSHLLPGATRLAALVGEASEVLDTTPDHNTFEASARVLGVPPQDRIPVLLLLQWKAIRENPAPGRSRPRVGKWFPRQFDDQSDDPSPSSIALDPLFPFIRVTTPAPTRDPSPPPPSPPRSPPHRASPPSSPSPPPRRRHPLAFLVDTEEGEPSPLPSSPMSPRKVDSIIERWRPGWSKSSFVFGSEVHTHVLAGSFSHAQGGLDLLRGEDHGAMLGGRPLATPYPTCAEGSPLHYHSSHIRPRQLHTCVCCCVA